MRPLRRRILKLTLLGAGLAAGFVTSAGADLPPLPTITLPTVTLPTVTLPVTPPPPPVTVPVPPLPPPPPVHVPPLPPPVTPPGAPAPPRLPLGGPSGSAGGSAGTGGTTSTRGTAGGTSGTASAQRARRSARVYRLRLSRDWIAERGRKRQRHTTVVFVLRNPSLVEFVIVQVSPDCRRFARFRVAGHQGVNRVRLGPRVGRHRLRPGTYRLIARAVPGGRRVVDARLVVVRQASRSEIESARGADTCASRTSSKAESHASPGAGSTRRTDGTASSPGAKSKPARHEGVLGTKFARNAAGRAVEAAARVPLWLYALLVLAIALLAAASLPLRAAPGDRTASALARHRGALALAGAATLVGVMVAYLLL